MSYRPNADALGESVISFDVVVQLCDGSLPQVSAVMGFVHIHDGYRKRGTCNEKPTHAARFTCCGRLHHCSCDDQSRKAWELLCPRIA